MDKYTKLKHWAIGSLTYSGIRNTLIGIFASALLTYGAVTFIQKPHNHLELKVDKKTSALVDSLAKAHGLSREELGMFHTLMARGSSYGFNPDSLKAAAIDSVLKRKHYMRNGKIVELTPEDSTTLKRIADYYEKNRKTPAYKTIETEFWYQAQEELRLLKEKDFLKRAKEIQESK